MTSRLLLASCGLLSLLLATPSAQAQTPPPQNNPQGALQQINGPVSPSAQAATTGAVGAGNSDLAGLQPVNKYPVPKTFTIATAQTVFWTDNAFLTNEGPQASSFGYSGRFLATYVPYSTYDWTPSISFEQQIVRYDRESILDFNAQTLRVASKYDLNPDKSWSWTAADSIQRLYTDRANLGQYYSQNLLENEIDYTHPIFGQTNLFFVGAYNIGWRLTDPNYYSRVDNSLLFSIVYLPVREVSLQAYARPAIYAYTDNNEFNTATTELYPQGRTDYNIALGTMVTYSPIKEVSLNANFNWIGNYSNLGDREYRTISPALTLSGAVGF